MSPRDPAAAAAAQPALCGHEFDDGSGLCAYDVAPGEARCAAHHDDEHSPIDRELGRAALTTASSV